MQITEEKLRELEAALFSFNAQPVHAALERAGGRVQSFAPRELWIHSIQWTPGLYPMAYCRWVDSTPGRLGFGRVVYLDAGGALAHLDVFALRPWPDWLELIVTEMG